MKCSLSFSCEPEALLLSWNFFLGFIPHITYRLLGSGSGVFLAHIHNSHALAACVSSLLYLLYPAPLGLV